MKKAIVCILLTLLIASCANNGPENETTGQTVGGNTDPAGNIPPETEITDIWDDVPELDFGEDTDLLMSNISWATTNIVGEEITGDLVGDAQYNMKLAMEERFHTTINEVYTDDIWSTSYVNTLVAADDDTYEICFVLDLYAPGYANAGLVRSLEEVEYIDLSKPYWDQSLHPCVTIGGKTWFAFGCFDLSYYDLTHILTFNKTLIQDLNLDDPYTLVEEGRWTCDAFETSARTATMDTDGDGQWTTADSYGFTSVPKQVLPNFWMAAGEQSIAKDARDIPYLNIENNERFLSVFERVYSIMWDNGVWCPNVEDQNFWSGTVEMFGNNRALYAAQTFYYIQEFRDVDADFGILPYPKFEETQNGYHSRVEGGCKIAVIPITNKKAENAGALLESMAAYGYNDIIPQYYEIVLKRKNSRDEDSAAMLDLIFSTRSYDLGDTWWCNELRDGMFKPMFTNNNRALSSEIAKRKKTISKSIERTISSFID